MTLLLRLALAAAPEPAHPAAPDAPPMGAGQDAVLLVLLIAGVLLTLAVAGFFFYVITREEKSGEE